MFKKLVVVDAKGHLLGRLASYIAKTLLSGKSSLTQAKELQSSGLKPSISLAHSSETRLNSQNSWERDSWLIPAELSYTTVLPPESSGELSEACCPTRLPEELRHSADSKSLREFPHPMTPRRERSFPMPSEQSSSQASENTAPLVTFPARSDGVRRSWLASSRTSAERELPHGTRREWLRPTMLERPSTSRKLMLLKLNWLPTDIDFYLNPQQFSCIQEEKVQMKGCISLISHGLEGNSW